ncbi:MAG: hypothetical protein U0572_08530 [Phycisphaerales bacterium]
MSGRRANRARRLIPLMLVIGGMVLVVGIVLARPPAWWSPIARDDAAANALGEQFENACVSEAHRVRRPGEPWAVRVRDDDANAWLATRLPKWMEHAGMTAAASQVRFNEGSVEIAADVPDLPSVGVVTIEPDIANGELRAGHIGVALGRLPLPFARGLVLGPLVASLGSDDAPDELKLVAAVLNGRGLPAQFELSDGRVVRLRDIEVHDGELLLEFETLSKR